MAHPSEIKTVPAKEDTYPRCEICGWWDRKLRNVKLAVTPEERIAIHKWARHPGHVLPEHWFLNPEAKDP